MDKEKVEGKNSQCRIPSAFICPLNWAMRGTMSEPGIGPDECPTCEYDGTPQCPHVDIVSEKIKPDVKVCINDIPGLDEKLFQKWKATHPVKES